MCGICAYVGENAVESVVEGLKKLDYRGYDSCGVAYFCKEKIVCKRAVGAVSDLEKILEKNNSKIAIGHTRWATHGAVTIENSHPQLSQSGDFALVHNGIVENFEALRREFLSNVEFSSQTDTEIFVNLIEKQNGTTLEKVRSACNLVVGNFAIALIRSGEGKIYFARRGSPLMIAFSGGVAMAGSDPSIFAGKFEKFYILEDDEFAVADQKTLFFYDKNGKKCEKNAIFLKNEDFERGLSFEENHMLKEIEEQPTILRWSFFKFFNERIISEKMLSEIRKFKNFQFIACGTALHAAMLGARFVRELCGKKACATYASEFRYDVNILTKNTLYVFVSQSGETADTLACAKMLKDAGFSCLCVTNVPYCSLNKMCDFVLPTFAGREVSVASTKAYTAQIFSLLCFAVLLSEKDDLVATLKDFVQNVKTQKFDEILPQKVLKFEKIFFFGRENDFVTSLEGALKLKEISYQNCVALPAGELKHGSLALVDEKTLVIAISTSQSLRSKLESNVLEVKSRGGKVLLLSQFESEISVDYFFKLEEFDEILMPIVAIFPLQRLAFDCSKMLGLNPDKPRNLAKSVTVE